MSIKFVECDSEKVISELVAQFEEALGETLQPSDERRIFLNQLAQVIVGIKASINDTGNQVLLRTARGEALDAIGEMFGVERLPAAAAKCTLEFTLSSKQSASVTIPLGTRVTTDGNTYFVTEKTLVIAAGSTTGQVDAVALETGAKYNGFVAEQIKYIVDNVPYLKGVKNINETSGGSDGETDDNYRERIRLVHESFSTAGCADGYIYWAKTAGAGDVTVNSPSAGEVNVYVLKTDGTIPTANDPLISDVLEVVSAKDKRPLTDRVMVLPPNEVKYIVDITYHISADDEKNLLNIEASVSAAVDEYIKWQSEKIGRDINPDKLRKLVLNAGASRVEITTPVYTELDQTQIASLESKSVRRADTFSE